MSKRFWMTAIVTIVAATVVSPVWAAPVELKVKWPVGQRIVQQIDMKVANTIQMQGRQMQQSTEMSQTNVITVLKAMADGGCVVKYQVQRVKLSMSAGPQTLSFDSASDPKTDAGNMFAPMFRPVVGSPFLITVDAAGEVQKLEGLDELIKKMPEGARPQLSQMFSGDAIKQMAGLTAQKLLPSKSVSVGDTWLVKVEQNLPGMGGGKVVMEGQCVYKGTVGHRGRTCAQIDFTGTFRMAGEAAAGPQGLKFAIKDGKSVGTIWFDAAAGRLVEQKAVQEMNIEITPPGDQAPPIKTSSKQQVSFKTIKVEKVAPATAPTP